MEKPYTVVTNKDIRGRKITGYTVKQGDREWNGKTAKEAIAARDADIESACRDRHDPIVLSNQVDTWIGYFRFPDGWYYGRLRDRTPDGRHEVYGSGGYKTRQECERYMRCLLAGQSLRLGAEPDFQVLDDGCEYLRSSKVTPEDIAEHLVSVAWQRGAKIAKLQGHEVCLHPNSAGDVIADSHKKAESDRVYGLLRKQKQTGCWTSTFQWIEYLRGK